MECGFSRIQNLISSLAVRNLWDYDDVSSLTKENSLHVHSEAVASLDLQH